MRERLRRSTGTALTPRCVVNLAAPGSEGSPVRRCPGRCGSRRGQEALLLSHRPVRAVPEAVHGVHARPDRGTLEFCVRRPDVPLMLHYSTAWRTARNVATCRTRLSCSRPAEQRCNYNGCMSVSLTIRDLPEATRDMLRQRAEARRQSLNSYIVDLLEREAGLPTMSEWADMVETRARLAGSSDAAVEAVRELRDAV
jgi:antitoxin FitA